MRKYSLLQLVRALWQVWQLFFQPGLSMRTFTYAAASKAMFYAATTSSGSLCTISSLHRTSKARAQPDTASYLCRILATEMFGCFQVTHT